MKEENNKNDAKTQQIPIDRTKKSKAQLTRYQFIKQI